MTSAAGAAVNALDGDDPQSSSTLRGFAQFKSGRGVFKSDLDRTGLGDHFGAALLDALKLFGSKRRRIHIDGRNLGAKVKADRPDSEQLFEHGREQVLAGVLLHVVVAALPVDDPGHLGCCERCIHNVSDAVFFVDHFPDGDAPQRAQVEGLPAGSGIERGAVEVHAETVVSGLNHAGVKLAQIAILIVETFGHLAIELRSGRCDIEVGAQELPVREFVDPQFRVDTLALTS